MAQFDPAQREDKQDFSRFSDVGDIHLIENEELQCRTCRYVMEQVSECKRYEIKPSAVLAGQPVCPYYELAAEPTL